PEIAGDEPADLAQPGDDVDRAAVPLVQHGHLAVGSGNLVEEPRRVAVGADELDLPARPFEPADGPGDEPGARRVQLLALAQIEADAAAGLAEMGECRVDPSGVLDGPLPARLDDQASPLLALHQPVRGLHGRNCRGSGPDAQVSGVAWHCCECEAW